MKAHSPRKRPEVGIQPPASLSTICKRVSRVREQDHGQPANQDDRNAKMSGTAMVPLLSKSAPGP